MCYNITVVRQEGLHEKSKTKTSSKFKKEEFKMAAVVNKDVCVGCESCVGACPVSAISVNDGKAGVDAGACVDCGSCVSTCPVSAISQ